MNLEFLNLDTKQPGARVIKLRLLDHFSNKSKILDGFRTVFNSLLFPYESFAITTLCFSIADNQTFRKPTGATIYGISKC